MSALRTIGDWLDERTGWRSWGGRWLDHPLVGGGAWGSAIAASVATCFGVLALTGLLLMTAYAPSPQSAWASVHYVQFVQRGGWVVRGLHFWAAQSLFVLGAVHVVHGALAATYRKPGEIGWWLTLLVLGLAVAEGITGGLLPWDQLGWWARVVEGNIAGLAPVIGGFMQQMIAGGSELGALGLARAFTHPRDAPAAAHRPGPLGTPDAGARSGHPGHAPHARGPHARRAQHRASPRSSSSRSSR